ncbi:hypothetical protein RhiirA4_488748 [Rhizophagus irregularis]|uniref:Uncharacterized protein n=1 Tax=Rhizophagus irregularis TaxID=588596 RepID=A0A2I1HU15_9GLOM|nr:hypothetical protein RhiirA4_488748 [Rhizophagus irregularis]
MENIRSLLSESSKYIKDLFSDEYENKNIATKDINFKNQKYKWRIELKNDELDELDEPDEPDEPDELDELDELVKLDKLSVYSDKEEFLCSKDLGIKSKSLNWKILNNNALALNSYNEFMIIYEYDIHNKCIKTQYFIYKCEGLNIKDFSGPILPMTYAEDIKYIAGLKEYFTILLESIISIIEDERCLAKYGPTLLSNLVKSADPELTRHIEDIYNKCIKLVKEDPKGNLKFLNIITSSMNDLYKKYPDYITKFNSEMFMILNPFNERIVDGEYSHFYAFSREVKISKITRYSKFFRFEYFQTLFYLFLPYLLGSKSIQCITLIVPYIDYSRYPLEYSWWKEIFYPQSSSVFVKTCVKELYTNWNGEAVISFKWNTFGRIYYFIIWLLFMVFLVCFTIASYPTNSITQEIRIKLYQTSIAFGFYHLLFELRQFIWNPKKYFLSIWNLFGKSIYN